MRLLDDNCGLKEGGMQMGVNFLTKATSLKWELSEPHTWLCTNCGIHRNRLNNIYTVSVKL